MMVRLVPLIAFVGVATAAGFHAVPQGPDGKAIYESNCRRCHGVIGTPPKTMKAKFPKIATFDAAFIASHSEDSIVKILVKGKGEDMKSFKDSLKTEEMVAVAKYVHELGSKAKP
jgi:mono/diheme cytochrome c family protein